MDMKRETRKLGMNTVEVEVLAPIKQLPATVATRTARQSGFAGTITEHDGQVLSHTTIEPKPQGGKEIIVRLGPRAWALLTLLVVALAVALLTMAGLDLLSKASALLQFGAKLILLLVRAWNGG